MAKFFTKRSTLNQPLMVVAGTMSAALLLVVLRPNAGSAMEPRPWLCRDLPAFSSSKPMVYRAKADSSQRWELSLLQFQQGAPHDNLMVEKSMLLDRHRRRVSGHLAAGMYYAVAQYADSHGHWICPSRCEDENAPSYVASFCFSPPGGGCAIRLRVKSTAAR